MPIYMTAQEFFQELEDERAARPWYVKAYHAFRSPFARAWFKLRMVPGYFVNRYQRSKFGIGYRDMWDFSAYICGVIAHAAEIHAEEGYTFPGPERGFTEEEWKEFLLTMARELREHQESYNSLDYSDGWDVEYDKKLARARVALHRFASEFDYIGD